MGTSLFLRIGSWCEGRFTVPSAGSVLRTAGGCEDEGIIEGGAEPSYEDILWQRLI